MKRDLLAGLLSLFPSHLYRYCNSTHCATQREQTLEMFISLTTNCFPSAFLFTSRAFPKDPSPIFFTLVYLSISLSSPAKLEEKEAGRWCAPNRRMFTYACARRHSSLVLISVLGEAENRPHTRDPLYNPHKTTQALYIPSAAPTPHRA